MLFAIHNLQASRVNLLMNDFAAGLNADSAATRPLRFQIGHAAPNDQTWAALQRFARARRTFVIARVRDKRFVVADKKNAPVGARIKRVGAFALRNAQPDGLAFVVEVAAVDSSHAAVLFVPIGRAQQRVAADVNARGGRAHSGNRLRRKSATPRENAQFEAVFQRLPAAIAARAKRENSPDCERRECSESEKTSHGEKDKA